MKNSIFAKRIYDLRKENALTLEQLGESVGISKSGVAHWEKSGVVPNDEVLKKLSSLFSVSIDYLVGNESIELNNDMKKEIYIINRGLTQMGDTELEKAKQVLKAVFEDYFDEIENDEEI